MADIGHYEAHRDEFLRWVADNQDEIRKALRKNITMDDDIFDDVTANTTMRIADYITKNHADIKSFKGLFFISAKREYIATQNKKRENLKIENRDFFDNIYNGKEKREKKEDLLKYHEMVEEMDIDVPSSSKVHRLFVELERILNENFPPAEVDIFLIYYRLKSEKSGISYKKLARLLDKDVKEITRVIQGIKRFIRMNDEIVELKDKIMKDDDSEFD